VVVRRQKVNGSMYINMYSCTLVLEPLRTVSHCDVLCHRRDTSAKWDEEHYLPHRPVVKESGTTKVRPVFDASARERGQPSLNQCLENAKLDRDNTGYTTTCSTPPDWNHSRHQESILAS